MMSHRLRLLDPEYRAVEPYCDCEFPQSVSLTTYKGHIPDLVKCRCGEPEEVEQKHDSHTACAPCGIQWSWQQNDTVDTQIVGADITFHPTYSQGTAIVRNAQPLKTGMVHFWEMRIITPLSGTDVMFGIGTDKVDLNQFQYHFVSALGTNAQSWGYSYMGKIQHNGVQTPYGRKFSQGCIVGVCLDRVRGTLEFYLNRRSLGIAYSNIPLDPQVPLYAMICSTAAKSVVRLINSTSQPECLQLRAFKALSKQPQALQQLQQMPGFRRIMRDYWFMTPPVRYSRCAAATELDIADEAVLSRARLGRKQKYKDEEPDINDLYTNAHKIAMRCHEDDEDVHNIGDYFDEYFHYLF